MGTRTFVRRAPLSVATALLLASAWPALAGPPKSPPPAPARPPAAGPAASREVTLKTADKLQLAATFWPGAAAKGPGVVLLPMYKSDRRAWQPALAALRSRGIAVLAIDLRGHGGSAKQGKVDLAPQVEKRDPKLFAAMHEDAIAAVRWLATEGGCDPKKIVLVGASVGGSVSIDAVARHPTEIAGVLWMSPGPKYLDLDTAAHLRGVPAAMPVLFLSHRGEVEAGAQRLVEARPATRLVVYDDAAPADLGDDATWAHGTNMLGRLPLVERTIASFVDVATGSKADDVVLDGVVLTEGPNADPWDRGVSVAPEDAQGSVRAYRVGRRIVFGGTVPAGVRGLRFEVQTADTETVVEGVPMLGPPQVVAYDLGEGKVTWSWGGMGSMPGFPGLDQTELFGKTVPAVRAVSTDTGMSFEGEWYIPLFGGTSKLVRILILPTTEPPPRSENGAVGVDLAHAVNMVSR